MDKLTELIEDLLEIPFISEGGALMDGSYTVAPYYIDSLVGDGEVASISVYYAIDLFYTDRSDAVNYGIALYKALMEDNSFCCQNPDVTYEEASNYWRTTLRAQEVILDE